MPKKNMTTKPNYDVIDYSKDANTPNGFDSSDFVIPYIKVLQSGSGECKRSSGEYIPGAEEGLLINSVTKEITEYIYIIPCHHKRQFTEYTIPTKKSDMGEFIAVHSKTTTLWAQCERDKDTGRMVTPSDTELKDGASYVCLHINDKFEPLGPVMVTLRGSGLAEARRWNTMMNGIVGKDEKSEIFTMPMYSQIYKMGSQAKQKGEMSWCIAQFLHTDIIKNPELYQMARQLHLSNSDKV